MTDSIKTHSNGGITVTIPAPSNVSGGEVGIGGAGVYVYLHDASAGEPVAVLVRGIIRAYDSEHDAAVHPGTIGAQAFVTSGGDITRASPGNTPFGVFLSSVSAIKWPEFGGYSIVAMNYGA